MVKNENKNFAYPLLWQRWNCPKEAALKLLM